MRIPAITTPAFGMNNQPKNYATRKQKGKQNHLPNFKAIDPAALKKLPLDQKLSHLFSSIGSNDVILVGKSLNEVQIGLKKVIGHFQDAVKRLIFVKHGGLAIPMAFCTTNEMDNFICANLGDKPLHIAMVDDSEEIGPGDSITVDDGDIIVNNNVDITINTIADYDGKIEDENDFFALTDINNFATKVFDFSEFQEQQISIANKELMTKISEKFEVAENKKEVKTKKGLNFNDVGGLDGVITKLKKGILYPIKFPFAYSNMNLNRGFILYGPPGTGKTLLAQALANEIDAHYTKLNGLEMESKWVGESEENWRKLFKTAKDNQPAIIFIDEFDAVARNRGGQDVHGDKVVNQLLTLMSDVEKENQQVFIIAATNKLESVDTAVTRSGRFGEHIEVPAPDREGLGKIWEVHTRKKNIDAEFKENQLLDKCAAKKMTGADIAFLTNKAHEFSWERCGVYEKMENGTLTKEDLATVVISEEDFNKAFEDMTKSRTKQTRNPVGYASYK